VIARDRGSSQKELSYFLQSLQEAPLFLPPEQVKLALTKLEFRDPSLVFLDGALGLVEANAAPRAGRTAVSA
jgi:hypothetical protein